MIKFIIDYITIFLSGLFDRTYYLNTNTDVKKANFAPILHYMIFGWKEGRNPSNEFVTNFYLELNPEVKNARINPLVHFIRFGKKEAQKVSINVNHSTEFIKKILFSSVETRDKVQQNGVNVLPCNFYSSTPSVREIEESYEYNSETPPYLISNIFDQSRLQKILHTLIQYSKEFNPPIEGDEDNCDQFFWENSQFSYSDAMAYYCFIRMIKPKTIVEIGAGFSTLIALEAIQKNGFGSITCIEPYPREFIRKNKNIDLHCIKAQDIQVEFFNELLLDGDILFLDSTHTVKTGSDCLHIYLRLLPEITKKIYVHVHDVFLPFGLPKDWLLGHQLFWTEQYLLLAFLIDNPKATLLFGSNYNSIWNPKMMAKFMGDKYPFEGGSIWFLYENDRIIK